MPVVLTRADTLTCTFQGIVTARGDSRLEISGNAVLTETSVAGNTVAGCNGPASQKPKCSALGSIVSGTASKLIVGNGKVLLAGMSAKTDQEGDLVVPTVTTQTKLTAS